MQTSIDQLWISLGYKNEIEYNFASDAHLWSTCLLAKIIWPVPNPLGFKVYYNSMDLICCLTTNIISNCYWNSSFKTSFPLLQQPYQIHQIFYLIHWNNSSDENIYNLNGLHLIAQALLIQYQDN